MTWYFSHRVLRDVV